MASSSKEKAARRTGPHIVPETSLHLHLRGYSVEYMANTVSQAYRRCLPQTAEMGAFLRDSNHRSMMIRSVGGVSGANYFRFEVKKTPSTPKITTNGGLRDLKGDLRSYSKVRLKSTPIPKIKATLSSIANKYKINLTIRYETA